MNKLSESFLKALLKRKCENKGEKEENCEIDLEALSSSLDKNLQKPSTSTNSITVDSSNEFITKDGEIIEIKNTLESHMNHYEFVSSLNENYGKIQESVIIEIELENGFRLLWKNKDIGKLLQIKLDYDVELCELVKKFIKKSLKENHLGIAENLIEDDKWLFIKQLDLTQLFDSRGYNLLFFAAEINSVNLIEVLLQNGFTVNDHEKNIFAVDVAWTNKNYEIITILLNNNSQFPSEFQNYNGNCEEFPENLRDFLQITRDFNEALDDVNEARLKEIIESHRDLRHFYQYANASAPLYALYKKNLQLYELFTINDIIFGPFEETSHIIQSLSSSDREKLEKIHLKYVKNLPEQHITVLLANTHFGHDIDNLDEKRSYVEKAFYHLNSIAIIQMILKCIAASKKFNIIFDFNRNHVQFLNPTEEANSNGLFDQSIGRMSIAAKEMLKNETKNQVFGVIAHELCHCAMFLVYNNDGKPYSKGDKVSERKFDKISVACERRSKKEKLIDLVYECYDDFLWHAELIVRIPHMIALYHDQPEKMQSLRKIYKPLFDYYEGKVMRDMEKALPTIGLKEEEKKQKRKKENWILKISLFILLISILIFTPLLYVYLQPDDLINYEWSKLNANQKDKILSSNFNFQGENVKITDLLNNTEHLNLKPSVIKDFLKYHKTISIDKEVKILKTFYIERKFTSGIKSKTFNDVIDDIKNNQFSSFILADEAGSGKTTTFRNLTRKLKSKFPKKWISHVVLREHIEAFSDDTNIIIDDFLGRKIFKLNDFENAIFKKFFNEGNVIILWDGFDEILPTFEDFVLNLLKRIKNETKNIQFISTRRIYAEKLENSLNTKSHKFIPYSADDRDDFIISYAEKNNFTIREAIKAQSYLEKLQKRVKIDDKSRDINNPLMLQIFLETFKEKYKTTSLSFYSIYENFMKVKFKIYKEKFKNNEELLSQKEADRSHQALALKFIVQSNLTCDIDILQNFDEIDFKKLSQIGIIDGNEFLFGHRTFAEFFIAHYLVEHFYKKDDYKLTAEEKILRLNLLFHVLSDENYKIIQEFLNDYEFPLKVNQLPSDVYLNHLDENLFKNNFLIDQSLKFVNSVSNFFKIDQKMLNSLWHLNYTETFFIWYFKESENNNFNIIHDLSLKYFPNNQNQLYLGQNQRANILFNLWKSNRNSSYENFYLQFYHNDIQFDNINNLKFSELFNTKSDELNEMLMKNSFEILNMLYFYGFHETWYKIKSIVTKNVMSELLLGANWKNNDTILHKLCNDQNYSGIEDFLNRVEENLDESQKLKLIFWKNRNNVTFFMLATQHKNLESIETLWNFTKLNSGRAKKFLNLKTDKKDSLLILSLQNEDKNVFSFIKELFEKHFTMNEIREHLKDMEKLSLLFLFGKTFEFNENLFEFLEKVYENHNDNDLRHLFSSSDESFKEIFVKFINSNYSSKFSKLITILAKSLTNDEKNDILNEFNRKAMEIYNNSTLKNDHTKDEIVEDIKNYFIYNLNIFNKSQIDFFVSYSDDKNFHEILLKTATSFECRNYRKNCLKVSNCSNSCPQLKSIYSVFESYSKIALKPYFSDELDDNVQKIAIKIIFTSDYVNNLYVNTQYDIIYDTLDKFFTKKHNKTYDFVYQPLREFFAARYFIEKLYKYGGSMSDLNLLIDIWSLWCDCKNISNFITNYISNDDEKIKFNENFRNLLLSKYTNILTKIDHSMIKDASLFFNKDEMISRKILKI